MTIPKTQSLLVLIGAGLITLGVLIRKKAKDLGSTVTEADTINSCSKGIIVLGAVITAFAAFNFYQEYKGGSSLQSKIGGNEKIFQGASTLVGAILIVLGGIIMSKTHNVKDIDQDTGDKLYKYATAVLLLSIVFTAFSGYKTYKEVESASCGYYSERSQRGYEF